MSALGWTVVGPVHTNSGGAPFFEMGDDSWDSRDEAIVAVREEAEKRLRVSRPGG